MAEAPRLNNHLPRNVTRAEDSGALNGKKVTQGCKPLFIALLVLGTLGLGAAATGFISFGTHQAWWSVGSLSNLNQIAAITMMAVGGAGGIVFLIVGIVGLVKNTTPSAQNTTPSAQADKTQIQEPFTVEMIENFKINGYKNTFNFPHILHHECEIRFSNGQERVVYLREDEIGNFLEQLASAKVVNTTGKYFGINRLGGFQVKDVLENLDGTVAQRVKLF